jgi:hypothetical protein
MITKINVDMKLSVKRDDENAFIILHDMRIPMLGNARVPIEDYEQIGYDGLESGEVCLDVIDLEQIPEGWTDEQIIDAYFNSEYGVA